MNITSSAAWKALEAHRQSLSPVHLRQLFASDPDRVAALSLSFDGILYDFSKQRMDSATLPLLVELTKEVGLPNRRHECSAARRSMSAKIARCCTSPCGDRTPVSQCRLRRHGRGLADAPAHGRLRRPYSLLARRLVYRHADSYGRQYRHRRL
jgi:hypothetical protein